MSDEDRRRAIERANSYREMMDLWAWKDFQSILKQHRSSAIQSITSFDASSANLCQVGEIRGALKELDQIEFELSSILNNNDPR